MFHIHNRLKLTLRYMVVISVTGLSFSCSSFIPTSGPSTRTIIGNEENLEEKTLVLDMNTQVVNQLSSHQKPIQFSELAHARNYNGSVGVGDILEVTIWEAPPAVLFSGSIDPTGSGSAHVTVLPAQMVDQSGVIKIPFVGNVRASGKTPQQMSNEIVAGLRSRANQPQVLVRILNNNSSVVTVVGDGNSLRMPLTSRRERILDAVSEFKGTNQSLNKTSLQLTRGFQVGVMPLMKIINDPRQNIFLQHGDVVSILYQPLNFVVLGATGKNQELGFEAEGITLAQALGRIGGLDDDRAHSKGIFIFRYESPETLGSLLVDKPHFNQLRSIPVVYRLDLKDPSSFFYAQNFAIQDKDILYVANAPAAELQKFLRAVFAWVSPATNTIKTVN